MGISLNEQEILPMKNRSKTKANSLPGLEDDPSATNNLPVSMPSRSISSDKRGIKKPQKTVCIITEFLEQGSLADILYGPTKLPAEIWTYELILTCALQAARGMLYLHSHQPPICHRDLKSSNLVVDDHWVVKVTDFGMSRIVPEKVSEGFILSISLGSSTSLSLSICVSRSKIKIRESTKKEKVSEEIVLSILLTLKVLEALWFLPQLPIPPHPNH
jgi:serine/threonine protein kinase